MKKYGLAVTPFKSGAEILFACADGAKNKMQSVNYETLDEAEKRKTALLASSIIPAIVLLGFTIEVGLKAALEALGEDIPRTHDLEKLYFALPHNRRENIENVIREQDFISKLNKSKNTFENWRYFFEETIGLESDLDFLKTFNATMLAEFQNEIEISSNTYSPL